MRQKLVWILLLVWGTSLGGCASGTKYSGMKMPAIPEGQGRMVFYRNGMPIGFGVQPEIKIDQVSVGSSQPNGFTFVDRTPGKYAVTCMTEWEHKIIVELAAGQTQYVHTYIMPGVLVGHVVPEVVTEERAMREIKDCCYNGPEVKAVTKTAATQP